MEHHTFEPKNCEFNDKSKFAASNPVTVIAIFTLSSERDKGNLPEDSKFSGRLAFFQALVRMEPRFFNAPYMEG